MIPAAFAVEARATLTELTAVLEGAGAGGSAPDETGSLDVAAPRLCMLADAAQAAGCGPFGEAALAGAEAVASLLEARAQPASEGFRVVGTMTRELLDYVSWLEACGGDVNRAGAQEVCTWTARLAELTATARAVAAAALETPPPGSLPAPFEGDVATAAAAREVLDPAPSRDVSSELAEIFGLEAHDHLQAIAAALARIKEGDEGSDGLLSLRRSVHTLKGAAGMVGFRAVSGLAHRMEDLLDGLCEGAVASSPATLALLVHAGDLLHDLIDEAGDRAGVRASLAALHEAFDATLGRDAQPTEDPGTHDAAGDGAAASSAGAPAGTATPGGATAESSRPRRPLRVPLDRLEALVGEAGELLVSRAGIEQHLRRLAAQAEEMALAIERLRRLATRLETEYEVITLGGNLERRLGRQRGGTWRPAGAQDFDELELDRYTDFHLISRELTETSSDLGAIGQHVADVVDELGGRFEGLGRIATTLQDGLMELRLVPLATLAGRLERTVRRAAEQQGKLVDFVLEGGEERLDTGIIDQVADALLHLLRNAVDHGIERPEAREAAGRPARGRVTVAAARYGHQVLIRVEDDGRGIDYARLRARGVEAGYLSAADAGEAPSELLESLMFLPGFSTRDEVSELSGRGIGLDVVQMSVRALDGRITVESRAGQGTRFTLRLPLTLAIVRALLVRAGDRTYAVPQASIREVRRVSRAEVRRGEPLRVGEHDCRPVFLADVLGMPCPDESQWATVLVVEADTELVAVIVDGFVEMRDLVVKPLPAHVRRVAGVAGATVLGDGQVVLILNPDDLLRRRETPRAIVPAAARAAIERPLDVLIVDDSLSVRRVLAGIVESAGWRPTPARDGLEALEHLQRTAAPPDVILLDIEMPRLDGFELTRTLRAQDTYREVPIVIISSRASDKHRDRALSLGATDYLVKPFQEDALLALVRRLTSGRAGAAA